MGTPRQTSAIEPRKNKVDSGSTAPQPHKEYTGTNMIGISIIHKSCLQPIFSEEAAKDVANMRR
jgi:hypothetical protein